MCDEIISRRIFEQREMRAVWEDESDTWRYAAPDVVGILLDENDDNKILNHWNRLKTGGDEGSAAVLGTVKEWKLPAPDGEMRMTDTLDGKGVLALAQHFPSQRTSKFAHWFREGENNVDAQSKRKAYALFEENTLDTVEVGTTKGLRQIHGHLFEGLYDFAGTIRQQDISKGGFQFAMARFLDGTLREIDKMPETTFHEVVDKYVEMNIAHPFLDGNGRSTRIWLDLILKKRLKKCVDWSRISKGDYMDAMMRSAVDERPLKSLLKNALTSKINDREMFRKGIDHSYHYEEID